MVVFRLGETPVATPWLSLVDGEAKEVVVENQNLKLTKKKGELKIVDEKGSSIAFYFEMWFSAAVQHGEELKVI